MSEADARVLLDHAPLFRRQRALLEQHVVADADLADVVQVAADLEELEVALRQLELPPDLDRELADAHGVTGGVGVARVDGGRERADRLQVLVLARRSVMMSNDEARMPTSSRLRKPERDVRSPAVTARAVRTSLISGAVTPWATRMPTARTAAVAAPNTRHHRQRVSELALEMNDDGRAMENAPTVSSRMRSSP